MNQLVISAAAVLFPPVALFLFTFRDRRGLAKKTLTLLRMMAKLRSNK